VLIHLAGGLLAGVLHRSGLISATVRAKRGKGNPAWRWRLPRFLRCPAPTKTSQKSGVKGK
jgi:hypothetical protein